MFKEPGSKMLLFTFNNITRQSITINGVLNSNAARDVI
ncbi:hypothetical protein BAZMOX_26386_0 [methanotrophic endosymbiont of Bathymodiolus azoricus (Menez Gwen)]|nr:hypothetical protein BAZMOX_26386_0 [methanotrophic endosymbiont of Bathymodiolus azoricus (Menez Gwen)]